MDANKLLQVLNKFDGKSLQVLSENYAKVMFETAETYKRSVIFDLEDIQLKVHPLLIAYCLGNYSPLARNSLQGEVTIPFKDVNSESVVTLFGIISQRRLPALRDFYNTHLVEDIHFLGQMLHFLNVEVYSEIFLKISDFLKQ